MLRILFFISTLSLANAHGLECTKLIKSFFTRNSAPYAGVPEYKLLKALNKVEEQGNFLRGLRGNPEPAINTSIKKEIARQDAFILEGKYSRANRKWRPLFRKVELAYVLVKKNKKVLDVLKELNSDEPFTVVKNKLKNAGLDDQFIDIVLDQYNAAGKDILKLQKNIEKILNQEMVILGSNYHRYALIRHHLEDLLTESNCDNLCQINIKRMLETMGLNSYQENARFSRLIAGETQPTFKELGVLLNQNPLSALTRMKKERNAELPALILNALLQKTFVDELFKAVTNIPGMHLTRAVRLFKLIYDEQARTLFFPPINRIVRSTKLLNDKFYMLKEAIVVQDGQDILITFARRVDERTNETWKALKAHAKDKDPDLFVKMEKAEKKAKGRGGISLINEESTIAKLAIFLTATGGPIGYYYFGIKGEGTSTEVENPEILLGGEEDQILDEVSEILETGHIEGKGSFLSRNKAKRLPASAKKPAAFTEWFMNTYYRFKWWLKTPGPDSY